MDRVFEGSIASLNYSMCQLRVRNVVWIPETIANGYSHGRETPASKTH